jgi:Flp pilus assembly pilin Flp
MWRRNGMKNLLRNVLAYGARDEAGAELPEWTIWVAVLALVGTALVTPVTNGLVTAFNTVLAKLPGVS